MNTKSNTKETNGKLNSSQTLDEYSLLFNSIKHAKINTLDTEYNYYSNYLNKYSNNNMMFSINNFYGFNFTAFIFSMLFFMYNGLWMGMFVVFLLSSIITTYILTYAPIYLYIIPLMFIPNILCGFLVNYFMIMKVEKKAKTAINKKSNNKNLLKIVIDLNTKMNSGKFLNLLIAVPYSVILFYFILIISFTPAEFNTFVNTFIEVFNYELSKNI